MLKSTISLPLSLSVSPKTSLSPFLYRSRKTSQSNFKAEKKVQDFMSILYKEKLCSGMNKKEKCIIMDNSIQESLLVPEELSNVDLKTRIWTESKMIWKIAFPAMVARVTSFGMIVVTQAFLGHIGKLELAAYALLQSFIVRFINGILIGMSSATETLCGQAFGARHDHMMGIYLQRSWIVDGAAATILLPLVTFAAPFFRLLGQEEDVAIAAGNMSPWFIPYVYYLVFSLTIQMYLQAQLKNEVVGWFSAISFVLHILLSWIFVNKLELGTAGAMGALTISTWSLVIGLLVYIFGGWCPNTWKGFTKAAFADILPVVKLSISSGFMICLEIWYNSIIILAAGYMKNATTAISAFSICHNILAWEFMLSVGFLGAACVRVANELGRGNAKAAKFSIKIILSTSIVIGVVFWFLCLIFGEEISHFLTSDEEVAETVSSLVVLLAFSILLNSVQPVLTGVAVGAGVQSMVAFVNLGSYYIIGLPAGILLGYVVHLEVQGLWMGLLSGVVVQTLILSYIIWRTDWDEQVNKASERLRRWFLKSEKDSIESSTPA